MTGTAGRQRVAIAGASGRMGRALIEAVTASPDLVLAGALDVAGSAGIGSDADRLPRPEERRPRFRRPARRPAAGPTC